MIYIFTGNNQLQIQEESKKWRDKFVSTYGDFNFFHIKDIKSLSRDYLSEMLLSASFFSDKKFILIENYPFWAKEKNQEETETQELQKQDKNQEIDEFFLDNFSKFPQEIIILLISTSPDKRTKLYKELIGISELREFNFENDNFLWKFWEII